MSHTLSNMIENTLAKVKEIVNKLDPQAFMIISDASEVVGRGFTHFKADGIGGAGGQAVAQTIAVVFAGENGFAIYHFDGAFVAGSCTGTAAVTFFLIDFDDFSKHD